MRAKLQLVDTFVPTTSFDPIAFHVLVEEVEGGREKERENTYNHLLPLFVDRTDDRGLLAMLIHPDMNPFISFEANCCLGRGEETLVLLERERKELLSVVVHRPLFHQTPPQG